MINFTVSSIVRSSILMSFVLSLAACGGGGGSKAKTFPSLSAIQGSYYSSSITCKGDEELNEAFEAEVAAQVNKEDGVMVFTTSSMGAKFPIDQIKCSMTINADIVKATDTQLSWNNLKFGYEGPECSKIPAEGKALMSELTKNAPKSGSMKLRYTSKILVTIDDKDGDCDAFVRIK